MKTICRAIITLIGFGFSHFGTAQNVGVGTTTPTLAKFQIQGSQDANMFMAQSSASSTGITIFNLGGYTAAGFNMYVTNTYLRMAAGFGAMLQFNSSTGDNTYWLSNASGLAGSSVGGWFQPLVIQGTGNVRVNNYFGVNANGHPDSGRVIIGHNSSTISPTLKLLETSTNDYARLELSNQASARTWQVSGYNDATLLANDRLNFWNSGYGNVISLRGDGRVGIGTFNTATGYKLSVAGKIICEELKVQLIGSWPDYVFAEGYNLRPLTEVEKFITTNKHLPGIPAASLIEKDGLSVGSMQTKMMEKIEELTLYLLQQQKEIKELRQMLQTQHK